jgi:hypothetical protein
MPEFISLGSYHHWVKTTPRPVPDTLVGEFLKTVLATAENRLETIPAGRTLFRAQRGSIIATVAQMEADDPHADEADHYEIEVEREAPLPAERMIPKAEAVCEGRVNRKGFPCIYLASTASAAIAEMRPWVGSHVTLAEFETMRDCRLVDCSLNAMESWRLIDFILQKNPDATIKEDAVWGDIGYAFSKPVTCDDPHLDYIPTQILAEAFRSHGCDGIIYKSLLDMGGRNIALFDVDSAVLTNRCLYRTEAFTVRSARVESYSSLLSPWPKAIESDFRQLAAT